MSQPFRESLVLRAIDPSKHAAGCVFHIYQLPESALDGLRLPNAPFGLDDDSLAAAFLDANPASFSLLDCAVPTSASETRSWDAWTGVAGLVVDTIGELGIGANGEPISTSLDKVESVTRDWLGCLSLMLYRRGYCDCEAFPPRQGAYFHPFLGDAVFEVDMDKMRVSPHISLLQIKSPGPEWDSTPVRDYMWSVALLNRKRNKYHAASPVSVRSITGDARAKVIAMLAEVEKVDAAPGRVFMTDIFDVSSHLSSTTPLHELEPTRVELLQCPKRHKGMVIYVRVVSKLRINGTGVVCLVEDRAGNCIFFRDEFPLPCPTRYYDQEYLQQLYPVGSVMAIKEPYVRFAPLASLPEIVVGVPVDVVLPPGAATLNVSEVDPTPMSASELKEEGRRLIVDQPWLAHRAYTRALNGTQLDDQEKIPLLLNLGLAALYSERPGSAWRAYREIEELTTSGAAVMSDEQRGKFIKRRAEAAQRLGLELDGTTIPVQSMGTLEVKHIPNKGLGAVAARDIKMGEKVMICKSLVHADHPVDMQWNYIYLQDPADKQKATNCWLVVAKVLHELIDDPRKAGEWAELHPRDDREGFAGLRKSGLVSLPLDHQYSTNPAGIADKVARNASATDPLDGIRRPGVTCTGRKRDSSSKVDAEFSKMNHSCVPNTLLTSLGEGEVVIATQDLRKGDEILTTYLGATLSLSRREEILSTSWGFVCACELCLADRQDSHETRADIMKDRFPKATGNIAALLGIVEAVEATYAKGRTLKPDLAIVLDALSRASLSNAEQHKYTKAAAVATGYELATEKDLEAGGSLFSVIERAACMRVAEPFQWVDPPNPPPIAQGEASEAAQGTKKKKKPKKKTPAGAPDQISTTPAEPGMIQPGTSYSHRGFTFHYGLDGTLKMTAAPELTPEIARARLDALPESERLFDTRTVTLPDGSVAPVMTLRNAPGGQNDVERLGRMMVAFGPGGSGEMNMRDDINMAARGR